MQTRVLKWIVPVDDSEHPIGTGSVLFVASQRRGEVSVWTYEVGEPNTELRSARVFGTGHSIPKRRGGHIGSCIDGYFVWHVFDNWIESDDANG